MKTLIPIILCSCLLFLSKSAQSQEQHLTVKALGQKIGNLYASKDIKGEEVRYYTKSIINMNTLIKKVRMVVENRSIYLRGRLISVRSSTTINGKPHSSSEVTWQNGRYSIKVDGESKDPITQVVAFSGSMLFFEEPPKGLSQSFSESSAVFMTIKKLSQGVYELFDPHNKRKVVHSYENGHLSQVKIKHPFMTIYMEPQG